MFDFQRLPISLEELKPNSKGETFDSVDLMYRSQQLLSTASNRYEITVAVARRSKRYLRKEQNNFEGPIIKPTIRAIIEMSDELTEPEILGE